MKNSEKNMNIDKKIILSQFDLIDTFINEKRKKINLINDNKDKIDSMIKILTNKIKRKFIIIITMYKCYYLEKIFNNINIKYLKKEFINNLKNLLNSDEDNSNSVKEIEIVRIKISLQKYVNNKLTLRKYFNDWINITNKKNLINLLKNELLKNKENKDLIDKNTILSDSNENNEIFNQNNKKKNELLNKIINIKNSINKNIIRDNFNKWKKIISSNKKTKKRIVKRNGYKKKNKKKNEIIKVKKIIDNIEILRNIMHRWKNNAYNIKLNDDYKSILNSFKIQSKENSMQSDNNNAIDNKNKQINNYDNLNEDLLNRLKKVSLHLILSKYQKIRDLLLKKYFYKWKNNTITNKIKKKNRKLIREISKYIRKKVGFCFKKKENEINNNIKKNNKEKTFAKKKTKLNLYKEKINHYKNFIQNYPDNNNINNNNNFEVSDINTSSENKFIINENIPEINILNNNNLILNENTPENNKLNNNNNLIINENTPESNKINNNNFIINKISNFTEPRYIIKKPGRRHISQNKIKSKNILNNDYYNVNENVYQPHISRSNEKNNDIYKRNTDLVYLNSNMENILTNTEYSSDNPNIPMNESKDKIINLIKSNSSQDESTTNNHISLVEETNEIRKPKNSINLSIKNKKNYFSPDKSYKIKNPRNLLTDNRPQKYLYPQNLRNNNNLLPYSNEIYIKTKNNPIEFKNITSPFRINEEQNENNNIYLYGNDDRNKYNKNYINHPKSIYYMKNNERNNYNNNYQKVNPLYERMRKSKMNSNLNVYYSPFEKKFINNKNKVKMIYNQDNGLYNLSESEEYNNLSKYGNETLNNNYNYKNVFY